MFLRYGHRRHARPLLAIVLALAALLVQRPAPRGTAALGLQSGGPPQPLVYPQARRSDQVDDYFGTKVADPYRWLEDPDSDETQAWIAAERKLTAGYFAGMDELEPIAAHYNDLLDYERLSSPYKRGSHYFYLYNNGHQGQSILYTTDALDGPGRVLLDMNRFSRDGTIALAGTATARDGSLLAYGLSQNGSDFSEWHLRDVATGQDLPDVIHGIRGGGVSWIPDSTGFYYSRFPLPDPSAPRGAENLGQQVYYHRVGTDQTDDPLVYEEPDHPDYLFNVFETQDERFLVLSVSNSAEFKNEVLYEDLQAPDAGFIGLRSGFGAGYGYLGNDGSRFYFYTNHDAPKQRVVAIGLDNPAVEQDVIPEVADSLDDAGMIGDRFYGEYLHDAHSQIEVFDLNGAALGVLPLPGIGSAGSPAGYRDNPERFFSFTSFNTPPAIYRYDASTGEVSLWRSPRLSFTADDFQTTQVFYTSKDGTRVPMFISYKKGVQLDGTNPTLLYGYGGFNISETPGFSPANILWMEMGGIFALPNIRGGGEYGEAWHQAGTRLNKQHGFDDFIAAAQYLIDNHYTSTPKLAIWGGSNGGLLVGAVETQRPDLFGAAVPEVGVMDMLRFQKFTIGRLWVSEYGSSDDPDQFKALLAYSPLQNIKPGTAYPPTLIMTADHDDRVVPGHSFKFAATMQADQAGPAPVLIRIEADAGHGGTSSGYKLAQQSRDRLAFLAHVLKVTVPAGWRSGTSAAPDLNARLLMRAGSDQAAEGDRRLKFGPLDDEAAAVQP
jgi:prolyl oligopeptidase